MILIYRWLKAYYLQTIFAGQKEVTRFLAVWVSTNGGQEWLFMFLMLLAISKFLHITQKLFKAYLI